MFSGFLIIGASNIDYTAISSKPLIPHDSNIGKLRISFGGVGRNITEDLVRLGQKVTFLTSVGLDQNGQSMIEELKKLGADVYSIPSEYPSSSYIALLQPNGVMECALCDSRIMDEMKVGSLKPFDSLIRSFPVIVLEANLNQDVIDYLFQNYPDHYFAVEAVSANKVKRFQKHLSQINLFKSNFLEARTLTEKPNATKRDVVQSLLNLGVQKVIVTDSAASIGVGDDRQVSEVVVPKAKKIVSESGCGDALFAGILSRLDKMKLEDAVRFAIQVSQKTLEVISPCNPEISKIK